MALDVNDKNFSQEVLSSEVPVMVDFWASWCGPCVALIPTVDEISEEYQGKAKVVKLNIDENEITAAEYGIRNIPTLLFIKDGKVVDKIVGQVPKNVISAKIDEIL